MGFLFGNKISLLRQIQNDAVDASVKVSDLLRKCKILAYRLGNEDFKSWVENELNGYPEFKEELPQYRVLKNLNSKGHFSGPFDSGIRNADIPIYNLPENLQEIVSTIIFHQPIAALEDLASSESELSQPWQPIILAKYGMQMYQGYSCLQAWKVIPTSVVIGIVDTIKTKILNFVLEIEMINKDAGDVELNTNPISQEKVSQVFNIKILGNVGNLSSGNNHSDIQQQSNNSLIPIEFLEIIKSLKGADIQDEIALEIEKKIEMLGVSIGTAEYKKLYGELMSFVSNHVTVFGFIAPFIPMLTSYLS